MLLEVNSESKLKSEDVCEALSCSNSLPHGRRTRAGRVSGRGLCNLAGANEAGSGNRCSRMLWALAFGNLMPSDYNFMNSSRFPLSRRHMLERSLQAAAWLAVASNWRHCSRRPRSENTCSAPATGRSARCATRPLRSGQANRTRWSAGESWNREQQHAAKKTRGSAALQGDGRSGRPGNRVFGDW